MVLEIYTIKISRIQLDGVLYGCLQDFLSVINEIKKQAIEQGYDEM